MTQERPNAVTCQAKLVAAPQFNHHHDIDIDIGIHTYDPSLWDPPIRSNGQNHVPT